MSPTIRDVARAAGVSVATASRVLSDSGYPVAGEVRARVLEAARALAFTPNAFARGLSKREFRLIGLVVPTLRHQFYIEIGRGCEDFANRHGYMVVLCNTERDQAKERQYVQELRAMRAGLILVGRSGYSDGFLRELATHPAPVVAIGRHELPCSNVQVDNVEGAMLATNHLIQLGHRRIAFIGGPRSSTSAMDRQEGFRRAMQQHGLPVDERLVGESDFTMEGGSIAMAELLAATGPPDALFAASDQMAIGAMHTAKAHGLRIPRQMSIVGFNDVSVAAFVDPPLTTIRLPLHHIGELVAEMLLRELKTGSREIASVVLNGSLVVRDSTAPRIPDTSHTSPPS